MGAGPDGPASRGAARARAEGGLVANDVPDARLAALAVEHGLRLATTDHGFPRLEWFDPLR